LVGLQLVPVVLSLLVLGAHFFRAGNMLLVGVVLLLLALLGVRRPWAARLVQVALVLGALEWVRTLVEIFAWRTKAGQPALRMAVILGCVTLVTAGSALVFGSDRLRRWYNPGRTEARNDA